mmetsp:Transcript_15346/g.33250  ORF Transcript_15346/g.33250 Transcript_15346/m.33250 type:complete len:260 (-) Transcript_15346:1563-2342(-)
MLPPSRTSIITTRTLPPSLAQPQHPASPCPQHLHHLRQGGPSRAPLLHHHPHGSSSSSSKHPQPPQQHSNQGSRLTNRHHTSIITSSSTSSKHHSSRSNHNSIILTIIPLPNRISRPPPEQVLQAAAAAPWPKAWAPPSAVWRLTWMSCPAMRHSGGHPQPAHCRAAGAVAPGRQTCWHLHHPAGAALSGTTPAGSWCGASPAGAALPALQALPAAQHAMGAWHPALQLLLLLLEPLGTRTCCCTLLRCRVPRCQPCGM